jgi:hypothetical protein
MRIGDNSKGLEYFKKVDEDLKVGEGEVKGIDKVRKVVMVVLVILYDGEVGNKN